MALDRFRVLRTLSCFLYFGVCLMHTVFTSVVYYGYEKVICFISSIRRYPDGSPTAVQA